MTRREVKNPFVSVIIPVFNDTERLERCVRALEKQSLAQSDFEVIVVDNGSPIPQRVSADLNLKIIREPKPGSYCARNSALKVARGEIFFFTDADCIPDPDWLIEGINEVQKYERQRILGGRVELTFKEKTPGIIELYDLLFHGFDQELTVEKLGYAATANLIVPKEIFLKVGFFDEALLSGGDAQWCLRAKKLGIKISYSKNALVVHPARNHLKEVLSKIGRVTGGHFQLQKQGYLPPTPLRKQVLSHLGFPARLLYQLCFREKRVPDWRKKIGLSVLVVGLRNYEALEWLKLALGKPARRGI